MSEKKPMGPTVGAPQDKGICSKLQLPSYPEGLCEYGQHPSPLPSFVANTGERWDGKTHSVHQNCASRESVLRSPDSSPDSFLF